MIISVDLKSKKEQNQQKNKPYNQIRNIYNASRKLGVLIVKMNHIILNISALNYELFPQSILHTNVIKYKIRIYERENKLLNGNNWFLKEKF